MNNKYVMCLCTLLVLLSFSTIAQINEKKPVKKMKEFILMIRLPENYGTTEATAVRPKWNALTDQWKTDSIWLASYVFPEEGYSVEGSERTTKKEYVKTTAGLKVVSTIIIRAVDIDAALKLAKLCPIIDQGGMVEVREIR